MSNLDLLVAAASAVAASVFTSLAARRVEFTAKAVAAFAAVSALVAATLTAIADRIA